MSHTPPHSVARGPRCRPGLSLLATVTLAGTASADLPCPVPEVLESMTEGAIPGDLMTTIAAELPEASNVNADFLDPSYDPNVRLSEDAQVRVTFAAEGAGFRNALGYFVYRADTFDGLTHGDIDTDGVDGVSLDELAAVPGIEIGIVFGNVSGAGSGGVLETGDAVDLGDNAVIPAGSRIGFFLVQNGWLGNRVAGTCGDPTRRLVLYTVDMLNPECPPDADQDSDSFELSSRHVAMLFGDLDGESILLGFEDLHRTDRFRNHWNLRSDEDFNDAVFRVTSNPPEAISGTEIPSATPVFPEAPPDRFLIPDCCNVDSTDIIETYLPERQNVDAAFLDASYDPTLVIGEDTVLIVSFVDEGASYRDSLGYFRYPDGAFDGLTKGDIDLDGDGTVAVDELAALDQVSVGIIYQNAAKLGGGGPLNPRDSVLVDGGEIFPAGSRVGFFLIQDGWTGEGYVRSYAGHPEDRLVFYTEAFLNPEAPATAVSGTVDGDDPSKHVAMLFADDELDDVLLAFEDLHRLDPSKNVHGFASDDDFNDAIFCVSAVTENALEAAGIFVAGSCTADIDGNGEVGYGDLITVLVQWGACPGCAADLDGDGLVGLVDLVAVLVSYGPCE